jgi:hypothetical protein
METKLILDIETTDAPWASVLFEQSLVKPAGNTKKQAIKDKQIAEKSAALQEKSALLESAPVIIIGGIARHPFQLFVNPCGASLDGVSCVQYPTEEALLVGFAMLLESLGNVTFVGHNIERRKDISGFDLPHLRFRFAAHNIQIPACMNPLNTKSIDTMYLSWKSSHSKTLFVTLEEIALRLGIATKPFPLTGKDIPELWQAGDVDACLLKNYFDLLLTQQVFNRLHHA